MRFIPKVHHKLPSDELLINLPAYVLIHQFSDGNAFSSYSNNCAITNGSDMSTTASFKVEIVRSDNDDGSKFTVPPYPLSA